MTDIPPPEFWATQNRLGELVPAVEALAAADPDHLLVGLSARRNSIFIYRRSENRAHADLEPLYRGVLPDDVALEFFDSVVTENERQLIFRSVRPADERLARRRIHVTQIGALTAGGPIEIRYWSPSTELTFDLLVDVGVTKRWPQDLIQRHPVQPRRVERERHWDQLGPR